MRQKIKNTLNGFCKGMGLLVVMVALLTFAMPVTAAQEKMTIQIDNGYASSLVPNQPYYMANISVEGNVANGKVTPLNGVLTLTNVTTLESKEYTATLKPGTVTKGSYSYSYPPDYEYTVEYTVIPVGFKFQGSGEGSFDGAGVYTLYHVTGIEWSMPVDYTIEQLNGVVVGKKGAYNLNFYKYT